MKFKSDLALGHAGGNPLFMKPHKLTHPQISITHDDWTAAEEEWHPNCGPTALAVMTGLPLMVVLPHIPHYKERHYTNPTMMAAALRSLGVSFQERDDADCDGHTLTRYGLVRIQWEGPWTAPGANPKWAYRATHWIGAADFDGFAGCTSVFDINNDGSDWVLKPYWEEKTVPAIVRECCRATGNWWATHRWELFVRVNL